jgi:hypothetical protein
VLPLLKSRPILLKIYFFNDNNKKEKIMSKGENKIVDLLNQARIKFVREKSFSDLKHGLFRYDFYLPEVDGGPAIIEFNGE